MSKEWPEGWTRPPQGARPQGPGPQAARPQGPGPRGTRPRGETERTQVLRPPREEVAAPRRGAHPPPPFARPRARRSRARWLGRLPLVLLLVAALLLGLVLYFYSRIEQVDAVTDYDGRPEGGSGTNWLIVGSDSREGLSDEQVKELKVGRAAGRRTDTMILLHDPETGPATLVSLPRDSYVPIPGRGHNKLNAAFALGGPQLLVQTVEQVTGLRIEHYTEIGFGGFVGMTDAVGGVELCPSRRIRDAKSGLRVDKGCQEMDGPTALAYVRARYFDPRGDLGRVERQQEFLGAVFDRASSPATLLNPLRLVALGNAGTTALRIDDGDGPVSLARFGLTMRSVAGGRGRSVTVPVADPNYSTPAGSAVRWDRERALELFRRLDAN